MGRFLKTASAPGSGSAQALALPTGTSGNRPGNPKIGDFRFNTDNNLLEYFDGLAFQTSTKVGQVAITVDSFTGDGSTTTFTLSSEQSGVNQVMAFIGGVHQDPTTAYTISADEITFTSAPPNGEAVNVILDIGSTNVT